jgi:TPR repeat protein
MSRLLEGENMNQLNAQTVPNYVTCPCQHCGGKIEFDANQLDATEIPTVPCPHCELQTTIFVPEQKVPPLILGNDLRPAIEIKHGEEIRKIRISAEQGDSEAQFNLGMIYYRGVEMPRDFAEVVKWWRKAAEQGHSNAQLGLGYVYQDGTGVQQNQVEALRWIRLSAAQGNSYAQSEVGVAYWTGRGLPKDFTEAANWFRKAAEQGHAEAQLVLGGRAYARGIGVPKQRAEAMKWLRLAAEQGYSYAQAALGVAYQDIDLHSEIDLVEAYKWAILAMPTGAYTSGELDRLSQRMKPSQKEEGQRLAFAEALKIKNRTPSFGQAAQLNQLRKEIQASLKKTQNGKVRIFGERPTRTAISTQVRREVWRRDGGVCVKCGSRRNLEYDHIVPVSKGGSNTARNVELLCESCNRSKSASIQ